MRDNTKQIYYLNELKDYEIAGGYPDVRGWEVRDSDNRVIGKVDNLLVNTVLEKVVYLDVEVDQTIIDAKHDPYGPPANINVKEYMNAQGENHIIIPIGLVDLSEDPDYVFTRSIDHRTFAETKRIREGSPIDRTYEVIVLDNYGRKIKSQVYEYPENPVAGEEIDLDSHVRDAAEDEAGSIPEGDDVFYNRWEFDDRRFRQRDED